MNISKTTLKKIIVILVISTLSIGLYYSPEICSLWPRIETFNMQRDATSTANIIQKDVYWFFKKQPKESFSERNLLPYLSKDFKFYVLRVQNKTVGFIVYKKIDPQTGNINLIGVRKDYRKHGYAEKLLSFACEDLFKDGCKKIKLFTRTSNTGAIKLYTKLGFIETERENGYVYFEKYAK